MAASYMEDESDSEDDDLRKKELKNNRSALQTYTSLAEFEMLHLKPKMNELHEYRGLKTDSKPVFSKNPEIYFYDYGAISTRPISVFKQLKRRPATAATSKMAKKKEITFTAFNMLEPILLSNRPEKLRVNPMHYAYKPLRNCEMYGSASVSSILERPHTSAGIRTTKGHSQRTRKVLQDIAHAEQIAQGEDWEESKGECRADSKGFDSESIDPKKTELLRAIRDRCHQDRIRAKDLFKPFFEPIKGITVDGSGRGGSLSLERFLHALETKKIILPGAIDLSTLFQIFHRCDPNFSGPVSMPVLRKLISSKDLGPLPPRRLLSGSQTRVSSSWGFTTTSATPCTSAPSSRPRSGFSAVSRPRSGCSGVRMSEGMSNPNSRPTSGKQMTHDARH